jgi:hypothetical protein
VFCPHPSASIKYLEDAELGLLLARIYKSQAKREEALQHFLTAAKIDERLNNSYTTFEIHYGGWGCVSGTNVGEGTVFNLTVSNLRHSTRMQNKHMQTA